MTKFKLNFIIKNFKHYLYFESNKKNITNDLTKNYEFFLFYFYKESKSIDYITYNILADIGYFKAGVSFKEIENGRLDPLLNLGLSTKAQIKDLDNNPDVSYIITISAKSDIGDNNIINVKSEVKKWLTKKVNVFGLYKHEYYNEKEDFQFKVGLGVKL